MKILHLQLGPCAKIIQNEKHYMCYLKIYKYKICTLEIIISFNALAGVILNPTDIQITE